MPKKVLFISKDANWQLYRNEVLTKLSREYDLDMEIATTGRLKAHLEENERLTYRLFGNWFTQKSKFSFLPGVLWHIISSKPDVVLALNNTTQLTEYVALILCRLLRIKFVWWTHGFNHHQLKSAQVQQLKKKYALSFLKKSDAIITFSPAGKAYLVNNSIAPYKVFTASNTLDTDKLLALKKRIGTGFDKADFLRSVFPGYRVQQNQLVLLFSGRLVKNKKVDNAIKVVRVLTDKGLDVRLLVVGDGKEKAGLEHLAATLNLQDRVHFAGAVFGDEAVTRYFLASDLFIMPGYIGLAIVHAFAFDLPVITEDIAMHSPEIQYLKPGINGCLTPEDNTEAMASAITGIQKDKPYFMALQAGTRAVVSGEANIHHMLMHMHKALFDPIKRNAS